MEDDGLPAVRITTACSAWSGVWPVTRVSAMLTHMTPGRVPPSMSYHALTDLAAAAPRTVRRAGGRCRPTSPAEIDHADWSRVSGAARSGCLTNPVPGV